MGLNISPLLLASLPPQDSSHPPMTPGENPKQKFKNSPKRKEEIFTPTKQNKKKK
jgi:hypothetical protein